MQSENKATYPHKKGTFKLEVSKTIPIQFFFSQIPCTGIGLVGQWGREVKQTKDKQSY